MKVSIVFVISMLFSFLGFSQADKDAPVFSTKEGAIRGYDPVAYFTENQPVKGKSEFSTTWNGATWYFSSAEHRQLFTQNPEKYAPQYGGWCAYGWAQGYPAKTEPDAWSIVDGKLYLNYNKDIKQRWDQKQAEFIKTALQNYLKKHHK
jgi:YHS domain-containing protein